MDTNLSADKRIREEVNVLSEVKGIIRRTFTFLDEDIFTAV